ncbi:MAG TPA: YggS family pyridoxal phosphate enzyme [Acidimicrobiales bacterium]|nr:YggS family pyridoxal phosphate enzyme [Acidimicrobiales bacterium]
MVELGAGVPAGLERIRERIRAAGGDPARVRVVAVTKGFGVAAVRAALAGGLADLGENYAEELVAKAGELAADSDSPPRWHYLGAIQRNKVARLAPHVALWQGVDRVEEGAAIARHAPGASVLVEVDSAGIAGRGGVAPRDVGGLVGALHAYDLSVSGLMTVAPPLASGATRVERAFDLVAQLREDLGLDEASMGMSDDLELAVERGATIVRVGRALFGPRPMAPPVPQ